MAIELVIFLSVSVVFLALGFFCSRWSRKIFWWTSIICTRRPRIVGSIPVQDLDDEKAVIGKQSEVVESRCTFSSPICKMVGLN